MPSFPLVAACAGLAFIVACAAALAQDARPGFAQRCEAMAERARFSVVFEDAPVVRENGRGLEELKNTSQLADGPYHQIYGLTRAQGGARYTLRAAVLADADGSVCAVPSLALTLGGAGLTVYLARELTDACRRAIVDEHELEHVAIWRNHLRAGARLMEPTLRIALAQPFYFPSAEEARSGLRSRVDEALNPLLKRLQEGIIEANRQIDSPQSYQATARRLRACP